MINESVKYELLVKDLIKKDFDSMLFEKNISHNKKYLGKSGHNHQIDVSAELTIGNINFLVLVECKYYSKSVSIKEVLEFSGRLNDIAANKGILISTIGFQKGAIKFAKANRIALIKVYDGCYIPMTGGGGSNPLYEHPYIELLSDYLKSYYDTSDIELSDSNLVSKIKSLEIFYQYKGPFCEVKFNGINESNIDYTNFANLDPKQKLVFNTFCYSLQGGKYELDTNNYGIFDLCVIEYLLLNKIAWH